MIKRTEFNYYFEKEFVIQKLSQTLKANVLRLTIVCVMYLQR
ncbi:hypothetical protein rpr22_0480 [Rickettsia prowazekii str. Rp22]|uniref:Uncharacterized protein n=1 Tax=Rickettsia prowazekii (strain Rp22) TaxID=449216 RepID=D5AX44_RICPP|nr:hypothetical protein rpr22_0480 [Rickettsia prowazekii str. Rp22]